LLDWAFFRSTSAFARQQFRLGGQISLGLLKLTLVGLQIATVSCCDCSSQDFRCALSIDRLEDGANTSHQLSRKDKKVDVVKAVQRWSSMTALVLALK